MFSLLSRRAAFVYKKNDTFRVLIFSAFYYLLSRVDIVIRYIEVDFTFGLPDYVRYMEEFVISGFYSIHCTVNLAGTLNIVRNISRTSLNRG